MPLNTKEKIIHYLDQMGIKNYIIHNDLVVDVEGSVQFAPNSIKEIPLQFGKITHSFICSNNDLLSLKGSPYEVGAIFDCSYNQLSSLEFAPLKAGYVCATHNQLITLEGSPQKVNSDFDCSENKLTTLKGAPKEIGGSFICSNNNLTSLQYTPKKVKKLDCSYNPSIEVDDYFFDIDIKQLFIHRNPSHDMMSSSKPNQIKLFKDYYDVNNFLILKADELNQIIKPYKEKRQLEKMVEENQNNQKKLKL